MAIATLDQWIASTKQIIPMTKLVSRTSVAQRWFSMIDIAGNPGAGTLAVGNTANGVVPTDATAGYPTITFSTGIGYLSSIDFTNTVASRLMLVDRLFHSGAHAFNAADTLTSQPSYGGRIPGSNYAGTQIWAEVVTAFTGNFSVAVTYTNQSGTTAHTTGTYATGVTPTVGSMFLLPLQSGDSGVQKIESITGSVASVGTFNILVTRFLWAGRVAVANAGDCHGMDRTGMPQVFGDSALFMLTNPDSTGTGGYDVQMDIVSA